MNQKVAVQRIEFGWVAVDEAEIILQLEEMVQDHAPLDAPLKGGLLVVAEVHAHGFLHVGEKNVQFRGRACQFRIQGFGVDSGRLGAAADPHQFARDVLGGQHKIDASAADRIRRHVMEFRGFLVLREGDSAGQLDGDASLGAIRGGTGQDNSYGPIALVVRQSREEIINWKVRAVGGRARYQHKFAAGNPHRPVRRDDVNVVAIHRHAVLHFRDRNFCNVGKDFR